MHLSDEAILQKAIQIERTKLAVTQASIQKLQNELRRVQSLSVAMSDSEKAKLLANQQVFAPFQLHNYVYHPDKDMDLMDDQRDPQSA